MKVIIGLFVVLLIIGLLTFPLLTQDVANIKVLEKERISTGSGNTLTHKYLVFTEDETFENTDVLVFFKFGSSDLQRKLREGKEYKVLVCGWRIPFFSSYRNIIKIQEEGT